MVIKRWGDRCEVLVRRNGVSGVVYFYPIFNGLVTKGAYLHDVGTFRTQTAMTAWNEDNISFALIAVFTRVIGHAGGRHQISAAYSALI